MAEEEYTVMEFVCAFFSTMAICVLTASLYYLWKQKIEVEKNLKFVIVIEALAVIMRAAYNYLHLAFAKKDKSNELEFALWLLHDKSSGLMSLVFMIIIAKLFALLIAFSRRRLSKSLELIKRSNKIILYLSLIIFGLMVVNDILILILYLASADNQDFQSDLGNHILKSSLIEIIIGAILQVAFLLLLWPMSRMFKKAIHMQKLEDYFRKEKLPRYSIRIFIICYVMRAMLKLVHGGWAIWELMDFASSRDVI